MSLDLGELWEVFSRTHGSEVLVDEGPALLNSLLCPETLCHDVLHQENEPAIMAESESSAECENSVYKPSRECVVSAALSKPLPLAAQDLGISCSSLKKRCRQLGLLKWPFKDFKVIAAVLGSSRATDKELALARAECAAGPPYSWAHMGVLRKANKRCAKRK